MKYNVEDDQKDEGEGGEHESGQRWHWTDAPHVQELKPEVQHCSESHYCGEWFGPVDTEKVEQAQHLKNCKQLAAHDGDKGHGIFQFSVAMALQTQETPPSRTTTAATKKPTSVPVHASHGPTVVSFVCGSHSPHAMVLF